MDNIDLKQLQILDEIYKTCSLTRAAENLDLGQPAVSMALARLRKHYDDALFVRTALGMSATPLTEELIGPIRATLTTLRAALHHRASFDARTSDRMFRLCMTDIGQRVMMPRLLDHLRTAAPSVRLEIRYVSTQTPRELETGEIDLALGFLSDLQPSLFQQNLFDDRFVCIANRHHPRLKNASLTRERFESESHLSVSTSGTGHGVIEKVLESEGIRRRIGLVIPNFLGVISHIAATELIAIVPERFARVAAETNPIKIFELPFDSPGYTVMQHWHERFGREPAAGWLRSTLFDLFRE